MMTDKQDRLLTRLRVLGFTKGNQMKLYGAVRRIERHHGSSFVVLRLTRIGSDQPKGFRRIDLIDVCTFMVETAPLHTDTVI
jgi:hypothetical protein